MERKNIFSGSDASINAVLFVGSETLNPMQADCGYLKAVKPNRTPWNEELHDILNLLIRTTVASTGENVVLFTLGLKTLRPGEWRIDNNGENRIDYGWETDVKVCLLLYL